MAINFCCIRTDLLEMAANIAAEIFVKEHNFEMERGEVLFMWCNSGRYTQVYDKNGCLRAPN